MSSIKLTNRSLIPEMDQHVKRMLKLIEEDADSFTKKVEMYYQKRPELINLVEDVYRMYRSLAERYDHVTGELRKNIPSDLQSQCSGITDLGSDPPSAMPSPGPSRRQSGHRAPGFDFFLGHYNKEGDESPSTLDSESESDDSSVNYYSGSGSGMHGNEEEQGLRRKIILLEVELREVKEKLKMQEEGSSECCSSSFKEATECINVSGGEVLDSECRILTLWEEHRLTREKLQESEQEVARLRQELSSKGFPVQNMQDQLKMAQKELSLWKNKIEQEKGEVAKLENRVARYKNHLADRDQEIRGLKEAISSADKNLSENNEQLQAEITKLLKERSCLEDNVKELDLRCQSLEEDMKEIEAGKDEMEAEFGFQIEQLKAEIADKNECIEELKIKLYELKLNHDVLVDEKDDLNINIFELGKELTSKDDQIDQMSSHLHQLQVEHVDLIAGYEGARKVAEELRLKIKELEREVEKKQHIIVQGAEEKREAIRQLCFSLEHYRNGYHRLREVVGGNNVIAS